MKLTPCYDVTIEIKNSVMEVYFGRLPSLEVVQTICQLLENPGIAAPDDYQEKFMPSGRRLSPQRLYYWIYIAPVYRANRVGRGFAIELRAQHGLTVFYQEAESDMGSSSTVYKPAEKGIE